MLIAAWILAVLAAVLVLAGAAFAAGRMRWTRATRHLLDRLESGRRPLAKRRFAARDLDGLPAPVRRYLRTALSDGQLLLAAARFTHTGQFNLRDGGEAWRRFRSRQAVVVERPGFVWDATIAMAPGVPVRVHDAYLGGEGRLSAAVAGLIPVASERGAGELARGELMRWLAEAAWYPTALLPGASVAWSAIDAQSALATAHDGDVRVVLRFRFGEHGLVERVRADARGRTTRGRVEMLAWEGRFWNYTERAGMRVPLDAEVAWVTPAGLRPYWRGRLETIEYEFVRDDKNASMRR